MHTDKHAAALHRMAEAEGPAAADALILESATPHDRLELARQLMDAGLTRAMALEVLERLAERLSEK